MTRTACIVIVALLLCATAFARPRGGSLKVANRTAALKQLLSKADTAAFDLVGALPTKIDWRQKGYVSTPINTGQCGSLEVAAAVAANVEGVSAVKNNKFLPVSAYEIVDCAMGNCNGGDPDTIYQWFLSNTAGNFTNYPGSTIMPGQKLVCNTSGATTAKISSFKKLPQNEKTIALFVATYGPVFAGLNAIPFESYTNGIMTAKQCGTAQINSAMTIVGYNTETPTPYWILKNAWGTQWGEGGYAYLEFGANACGIQSYATTAFATKL